MRNLRQLLFAMSKGLGRFRREALIARREAYKGTSRLVSDGRKSPIKI